MTQEQIEAEKLAWDQFQEMLRSRAALVVGGPLGDPGPAGNGSDMARHHEELRNLLEQTLQKCERAAGKPATDDPQNGNPEGGVPMEAEAVQRKRGGDEISREDAEEEQELARIRKIHEERKHMFIGDGGAQGQEEVNLQQGDLYNFAMDDEAAASQVDIFRTDRWHS